MAKKFAQGKYTLKFPEKYVEMHYQPVIKVSDQSLAGYEALVRLKDDERLVMPFEFIGLAETSGLIQGLSFAIFRAICADLKRHRVSIDINVAVNLSPIQFKNPQLFEVLTEIAKEYGLSINQFSFEVTETATIENLDLMYESLVKMRESDVDVLLDDFGTGYASLSLLKDLPVDYIKIDRSFVSGLHESDDNAKLTEGLIAIAHALRLKTVAEGVETQAQYQWLAEQKVDLIQGYLFGKPSPMRDWVNQ